MKIKSLFLILIVLASVQQIFAQEGIWVEASGKYNGANITPDEGQKRALDLARAEAIKKVVGLKIGEETYRKVSEMEIGNQQKELFDIFSRLSRSTASGKIIEEEYYFENTVQNNIPFYIVNLKALVVEESVKTDPNFSLKIIMTKDVFYDRGDINRNDKLEFQIEATKDCYLYIFNILANDSVQLVIPNQYIKDNYYQVSKDKQEYENAIKNLGMNFTVGLSKDRLIQTEALYVIGLKEKKDFISQGLSKDDQSIIPTYRAALTDIMSWLIQVPVDQRTEAFKSFEIRKL